MESRAATGIVPSCVESKEFFIILPLMIAPMTSLATALTYSPVIVPPGGVWKTVKVLRVGGKWRGKNASFQCVEKVISFFFIILSADWNDTYGRSNSSHTFKQIVDCSLFYPGKWLSFK